jgi:hypothetical protein
VYAGHAAIALVLKAQQPRTPMLAIALAAYGPDWVDTAYMIPHPREAMAPYSHSVPAVLLGALLSALLYWAVMRRPGALTIAIAWASHWPADLITGLKPVIGLEPLIGLDLYHLPVADFIVETILVSVACVVFAKVFATTMRQRILTAATGACLAAAQLVLDMAVVRLDPRDWRPSLAEVPWRPHVNVVAGLSADPTLHGSCTARLHSQWSETCRRRDQKEWSRWSA